MMNFVSARQDGASGKDFSDSADNYTRIGEMAQQFGVTLRALRFYEDKGLLHPRREGTMRLYSREDKTRLKLVLLGRKIGFSLRDVKQILDLHDPEGSNVRQLRMVLDKSERQLARLEKERVALDDAISEVKELISDTTSRLGAQTVRA